MWQVNVITTHPGIFPGPLGISILNRASLKGLWRLNIIDIKDFGIGKYNKIDDEIYGPGPGMLMLPEVAGRAIDYCAEKFGPQKVLIPTASGESFNDTVVTSLLKESNITMLCPRFEGIDCRVAQHYNALEVSVGNYIMTGGEIPVMSIIDACVRKIPGALGSAESLSVESFSGNSNYREHNQYTRPVNWRGHSVPDVLRSGNHMEIANWQKQSAKSKNKE